MLARATLFMLPLLTLSIATPVSAGWRCLRGSDPTNSSQSSPILICHRVVQCCPVLDCCVSSFNLPCCPIQEMPTILPTLAICDSSIPDPVASQTDPNGFESANIGVTGAAVRSASLDSTNTTGVATFGSGAFGSTQGLGGFGGGSGVGGSGIGGAGIFLGSNFGSQGNRFVSMATNSGQNPLSPTGTSGSPTTNGFVQPTDPFFGDDRIFLRVLPNVNPRTADISDFGDSPLTAPTPSSLLLAVSALAAWQFAHGRRKLAFGSSQLPHRL